jgi:hypothetical protein
MVFFPKTSSRVISCDDMIMLEQKKCDWIFVRPSPKTLFLVISFDNVIMLELKHM